MGGVIIASPTADENAVYLPTRKPADGKIGKTFAGGVLHAVSPRTGLTLWVREFPSFVAGRAVADGKHLFIVTYDGILYCLSNVTGETLWSLTLQATALSQPVLSDGRLFLGDENGFFHSLDARTGKTLWRYRTRAPVRVPAAFHDSVVYTAAADGYIYAILKESGERLWRVRAGAAVQSLVPTDKCIIATSFDNFAYCLSHQSGQKIWKHKFGARVLAVPLVASDGILFAPLSGSEYVVLESTSGRKVNSIVVGEDEIISASPINFYALLLLPTRKGLYAYTQHSNASSK